jgi:hypothetical protein
LLLDPGDRIDAVLTIPANAADDSVLTLWTEDYQRTGAGYANIPTVPVAHFKVKDAALNAFATTVNTPLLTDPVVNKSVELLPVKTGDLITPPGGENGTDNEDIELNSMSPNLGINSVVGSHDFAGDFTNFPHPDSARYANLGDVLELTVTDKTAAHHPFHLHGFSMQPLQLTKTGSPTYIYEPEFRDNIDIPPGYTLHFRIRLDDRAQADGVTPGGGLGRWVFHCHIFFHATFGMISELDVVKKGLPRPNINVIDRVIWLNPGDPVQVRGTYVDRIGQGIRLTASIGSIAPVIRTFGMSDQDTAPIGTSTSGEFLWTYQARGGENQLVYLTITDGQGNTDQAAFQLTVNAPPAVTVARASGTEGTPIALHATAVDPEGTPVSGIHWTVTPGAGVDPGGSCTIADPSALDTTATCNDDGNYTLALSASDGNATGTGTSSLVVTNAPPVVAMVAPAGGTVFLAGVPVAVKATFTDAGSNDTHTCSISWGDGATTPGALTETPGTCLGTHAYGAVGGPRVITAKVSDDDTGAGTASVTIAINTARSLKEGVRATAATLLTSASRYAAEELRAVIRNLDDSLDPSLWIDGNTLDPRRGGAVFKREGKAVDSLVDLRTRRELPAETLQPLIDALETADNILAMGALNMAIAGEGNPAAIAEARMWLARATADRAAGRFVQAIEDYGNAWQRAVDAITPSPGRRL